MRGVGPAERTGKSRVSYCPGGSRPAVSADCRLPRKPREIGAIVAMRLSDRQPQSYNGFVDVANLIEVQVTDDPSKCCVANFFLVTETRYCVTRRLAHLLLRISDRVLERKTGMAGGVVGIVQVQPRSLNDCLPHLCEGVGRDVSKPADFLESLYRGLLRLQARASLFGLHRILAGKREPLYQRPEGEALRQERQPDHPKGHCHDNLPYGKGGARSGLKWNREGHHQRITTAETGPAQNYQRAPRRYRGAGAKPCAQECRPQ